VSPVFAVRATPILSIDTTKNQSNPMANKTRKGTLPKTTCQAVTSGGKMKQPKRTDVSAKKPPRKPKTTAN